MRGTDPQCTAKEPPVRVVPYRMAGWSAVGRLIRASSAGR